ncbi:alpha/beta hydrolase [Streptomyces sp. NBC_01518]|uniref:alpha/beta hydrolase n=1 Tax=Streptomyces sp. NBC_01518 TaxID=2903891 RepID=UPI003864A319
MGDDPLLYQIRVCGHLGPTLLTAFPAFAPEQQGTETVLTGLLQDASALYGVLAEVEALGLDLLEVRRVRPPHHLSVRPIVRPDQPPPKGERSVSTEQQDTLDAILRQSALPVGSDVAEQRRLLRELTSAQPLPPDVTMTSTTLGGVPVAAITVDGVEPRHVVLYFHGGVYVLGDAAGAAGLAAQVGRRTSAKVYSVDYRLAPEHPYPAAVDDALATYEALLKDGIAASDIVLAGESAGGGLVVATLVNARDRGLPLPAAAYVMSPYADLTLAGASIDTKREADPLLSRELLEPRVADYTAGQDPALGLISPVFADLAGLPPLIIQVGSHEVLLDDAVRLAQRAAAADVEVTLEVTPRVPHVFQAYQPLLDEAAVALDRAGAFLSARLDLADSATGKPVS